MDLQKLSDRKLEALLYVMSGSARDDIQAEIDRRSGKAQAEETGDAEEQTEEMQAETRKEILARMRDCTGCRCTVIPFDSKEWVGGFIAGVVEDPVSQKLLYAVKTDDGRRIVKVHDSGQLRIDMASRGRVNAGEDKGTTKVEEWTYEAVAKEIDKVLPDVGKVARLRGTRAEGLENTVVAEGRIVSITPDKNSGQLLYKVKVPDGSMPDGHRFMYRVVGSPRIDIEAELDADGLEINYAYARRRQSAAEKTPGTPQHRIAFYAKALRRAEERYSKAKENLDMMKAQYDAAKAELDEYFRTFAEESGNRFIDPLF